MALRSSALALPLATALILAATATAAARPQPDEGVERATAHLVRGAKSGDFDTRALAIEGLGRVAKPVALPIVKDALADPQWAVRRAAIEALAALKETRAWEDAIIAAIADVKVDPDTGVMPMLAPLGPKKGVALLMAALRDPKFPKPERYATALVRVRGDWMVEGYRAALKLLKGPSLTPFELEFTKLPLPDALPLYKDGLAKRSPALQLELLTRLEASDASLDVAFIAPLLKAKADDVVFRTAALLGRHGNAAGKAVLVEAAKGQDDARRLAALRALEPIATADLFDIVRPLVKDHASDIETLLAAYRIFFKGGNPKLAAYLEHELSNTDVTMRAAAVAFIGEVKGHAAIADLVPLLGAGPLVIRIQAAGSLGRLGQRAAIPPLRDALNVATEKEFKLALIDALALVKDAEVIPVVRFYVNDFDLDVQRAAVRTLASIPHESGVPDLEQALSSRDKGIRTIALQALVDLSPERTTSQFKQALAWIDPSFLSNLVSARKDKARPHLELALDSARDDLRAAAFASLGHLAKTDQVAIVANLAKNGKRIELRLAALARLVELQGAAATALAVELVNDPELAIKVAAIDLIGDLGGKEQDALVRGLIDDPAERIAVAASSALLRLQGARR